MEIEETVNAMSFEKAAGKKWYLSMRPASPKKTLSVKFEDGKTYKFLGGNIVNVGDPVIIDYGGASSCKMGNVSRLEDGITIKRSHALKVLFAFTTDPGKTEIKKNVLGVKPLDCPEDVSECFNMSELTTGGQFHVIDYLIGSVLNAITVIAFPDLSSADAVAQAKAFLAKEKNVPAFIFGKDFTDRYYGRYHYDLRYAETAEMSFSGHYPGWYEELQNCSFLETVAKQYKVEVALELGDGLLYLYFKDGTKKLETFFEKNEEFKAFTNELVMRSALSIIIRGGFTNLLSAALSVEMPIKGFYGKLKEFAKAVGSTECYKILSETDYEHDVFAAVQEVKPKSSKKSQEKPAPSFGKDFVVVGTALIAYKGNDENVIIPNGVKTIEYGAFSSKMPIKSITFPDSVTQIKSKTFQDMPQLESVHFGKNISVIWTDCFWGCKSLKEIDLSGTKLKKLSRGCFLCCSSLEKIVLPETLKTIDDGSLAYTSIKTLTIPASVETIENHAFPESLTDLYFEGSDRIKLSLNMLRITGNIVIHCKKDSELMDYLEHLKKYILPVKRKAVSIVAEE